ncbi:MAG TPA: hypothetical protein VEW04_07930 [Allosphingosinicella sp.]|nr:hypothetical protein [Allosphingosinicella sp.]
MRASIALPFILLSALPPAAQAPGPLAQVERGQWQLQGAGGGAIGSVCLGDPLLLAQPQHGPQPCTREVISSDAHEVTVNYVCPGMGRGRTVLRVETPRLVQIDSQGLHNGAPFALRAQARKTGPC